MHDSRVAGKRAGREPLAYSPAEFASAIGVSTGTVRRLIKTGRLFAVPVSIDRNGKPTAYAISRASAAAFLDGRIYEPASRR